MEAAECNGLAAWRYDKHGVFITSYDSTCIYLYVYDCLLTLIPVTELWLAKTGKDRERSHEGEREIARQPRIEIWRDGGKGLSSTVDLLSVLFWQIFQLMSEDAALDALCFKLVFEDWSLCFLCTHKLINEFLRIRTTIRTTTARFHLTHIVSIFMEGGIPGKSSRDKYARE